MGKRNCKTRKVYGWRRDDEKKGINIGSLRNGHGDERALEENKEITR